MTGRRSIRRPVTRIAALEPACSFCRAVGHNIRRCKERKRLQIRLPGT